MGAGKLRHRITVEAPTETQNQFGEPIATWETYVDTWASREETPGQEGFAGQQVKADLTTRFGLRYVEGITAKMRLVSGGQVYEILSAADPDGRRRELLLVTSRVA